MKDKEIEKLLNNEGKKLFATSFDGVTKKLQTSSKYINRPKIETKKSKAHKMPLQSKIALSLSTLAVAGIICAVVVPVANNNINNLRPEDELLCDFELNDTKNNQVLKLAFDVNTSGQAVASSIYPKNELGKKLVAYLDNNKNAITNLQVQDFTNDLLKVIYTIKDKDNKNIMDIDGNNYLILHHKGPGAKDKTFAEKLQDKLNIILDNEFQGKTFTVQVLQDTTTYGNLTNDMFLARKSELAYFIQRLFYKDHKIINNFEPDDSFLKSSSLEKIENYISKVQNIYRNIPFDKDLDTFKSDLDKLQQIYQTRKDDLINAKDSIYNTAKKLLTETQFAPIKELETSYITQDEQERYVPPYLKDVIINGGLDELVNIKYPAEIMETSNKYLLESKSLVIQINKEEMANFYVNAYKATRDLISKNEMFLDRIFEVVNKPAYYKALTSNYKATNNPLGAIHFPEDKYWEPEIDYWKLYWQN